MPVFLNIVYENKIIQAVCISRSTEKSNSDFQKTGNKTEEEKHVDATTPTTSKKKKQFNLLFSLGLHFHFGCIKKRIDSLLILVKKILV